MTLKRVIDPLTVPVTISEAKAQIRGLDKTSNEDSYVGDIISSVTYLVEVFLGRSLITQTWDWYMDTVPDGQSIEVPRPPLVSITSINTTDELEATTLFAASNYVVDIVSEPGRIGLKRGIVWPSTTLKVINGFVIQFVSGYGNDSKVPSMIKTAIIRAVDALYSIRKTKPTKFNQKTVQSFALPEDVKRMLMPYKVFKI